MIPASRKKNYTELPDGLSDQLKTAFTSRTVTEDAPVINKEEAKPQEIKTVTKTEEKKAVKKNDRNGQINICVPPETKTDWKILFAKSNVNITQGIIFAVEHLKNEIEKGNALLTVGGVIRKN